MEKNREELKRSRVNSSQGAHSAGTYPGSYNMKRLGAVLQPLAWIKRDVVKVKNIHPKNTGQWPSQVLNPGPSALTTKPPRSHFPRIPCSWKEQLLHGIKIKVWAIACFVYPREVNEWVLKSFAYQLMKISGETGTLVYGEWKKKKEGEAKNSQCEYFSILSDWLADRLTAHWLSD